MNSGIYLITNINTNKYYIGSAQDLTTRIQRHKNDLKANRHHNRYLQRSYNKHGMKAFNIKVLEYVSEENLIEKEQYWIDNYLSNDKKLYNHHLTAGSPLGYSHTEETKKKCGIKNIGRAPHNRNLTLENCFEIKKLWLEKTNEGKCDKMKRLAKQFNINEQQIGKIRNGSHWSSKELGGKEKDWTD